MCLADKSFILGSHTKASACFTRYGCIHGPGSRVAVIFLIELVLFFFVLRMQIDIFCLRPLLAYVSGLASRRLEFKWFYDESFSHLSSSLVANYFIGWLWVAASAASHTQTSWASALFDPLFLPTWHVAQAARHQYPIKFRKQTVLKFKTFQPTLPHTSLLCCSSHLPCEQAIKASQTPSPRVCVCVFVRAP